MAWSSRDFEPQMVSDVLVQSMQQVFSRGSNLAQSQDPDVEATDIEEYDGRMRAAGLKKLNNTCYISAIHLYLTQAELDKRAKPKGVLVFYLEIESASKIFKSLALRFAEDEDDASMMQVCGQFAQMAADEFKAELASKGYPQLVLSKPQNYKNNINDGVEFSTDQKTKHEIGFYFFKHKALIVELSLAPIPKR